MRKGLADNRELKKYMVFFLLSLGVIVIAAAVGASQVYAAEPLNITIDGAGGNQSLGTMDVLYLLLFLAVVPSFVVMMTSFTRIIIVLSFLRNALGTQQSPPNMILTGLALILTVFIMSPVFSEVNETAYEPYKAGEMTKEEAFDAAQIPMKRFMLKQTEKRSLELMMDISKTELEELPDIKGPEKYMSLGLPVIVPSFVLSELNRAFAMGFLIFIPFLIIDMVVSSTLMSMGMVMLPPTMIALPFKILMFVLVDGWDNVIKTLVQSFK